jgi:hypothetical protein
VNGVGGRLQRLADQRLLHRMDQHQWPRRGQHPVTTVYADILSL